MERNNVASGLERLLLFTGLLLITAFAGVHIYSAIYSHAAVRAFWRGQAVSSKQERVSEPQGKAGMPDFRLWSEKRVEAYQISQLTAVARPEGVLRIPSIDLEVPVFEGTDEVALNRGAGHIEGTSALTGSGNIGIAGHRDGFFRGLKDIGRGDAIDLYTEQGNVRYVVDETLIVRPEEVSVLAARSKPTLTLVTCYPFYFVGSAPMRYIVHASIADSDKIAKSR